MDQKHPVDRHLWQIVAVRDLMWILLGLGLLWVAYTLRSVLTPVLIALVLAYLFHPLISWADNKWRVPRPLSAALVLVLLTVIGLGFAAWLGPVLVEQVDTLAHKVPDYFQVLTKRYGFELGNLSEQLVALAQKGQKDPLLFLKPMFTGTGEAFGFIGLVIGVTTQVVLSSVLIPVYFFFFSWSFDRMLTHLKAFLPASQKRGVLDILRQMDQAVSGFFRGRFIIALITGVLFAIGWAVTDVPYWFILGMGTGLLSIIPYASILGWPLALFLKYLDVLTAAGNGGIDWLAVLVWPSIPYLIVQFAEGWVLTPWIQSKSADLSTVTIIIVVLIGGALAGFYGLLLAIPIASCVKVLLKELLVPQLTLWAKDS